MRPYDAVGSTDEGLGLARDNFDIGDFWMLTDGYRVSIAEQEVGKPPMQHITIPRETFNRFIDWYMRDQAPVRK
jgi:hypothetical protein